MMERLVTEGTIALAVDFSMRAEMPSGPFAFDVSNAFNNLQTSSCEHSMSWMTFEVLVGY